ncbi:2-dehydropantoate 2-reductase N-terminal domain-containing protein [Streptomyces sp. NPDC052109]|uniref:ketopantoate reductase family protein n=1 Tax=Streptomyces sp. NPDC052109 TaxID=3155527 RepID=UPI0034245F66
MRYIIIGAGAVGGAVGGRLAQAGREVVLVARGKHLAALDEHGLRLRVPEGESTYRLPAVDGPGPLGELRADDVLVLAVKTQDTVAALDVWAQAPVAGGGTAAERLPLVCLQNGVESGRLALRRFRQVYGVCVWLPSTFVEPGVVSAAGTPLTGILHLGRLPHGTDDTARRIAADLETARFEAPVVPDVARWQYAKLLANLGNAVEALTGTRDTEAARALYARVRAEGEAVLDAAGIAHTSPGEQRVARGDKVTLVPLDGAPRGGGSSWQSLARGTGTIEADHLNGEIVLLGRLHGVPAPLNELLQRLANRFARERRAAGSMPVAELVRLADEAVTAAG